MHHLGYVERSHKEWINDVISRMKGYMMTTHIEKKCKGQAMYAFISQSDTKH